MYYNTFVSSVTNCIHVHYSERGRTFYVQYAWTPESAIVASDVRSTCPVTGIFWFRLTISFIKPNKKISSSFHSFLSKTTRRKKLSSYGTFFKSYPTTKQFQLPFLVHSLHPTFLYYQQTSHRNPDDLSYSAGADGSGRISSSFSNAFCWIAYNFLSCSMAS
jgi:hypothetical protein